MVHVRQTLYALGQRLAVIPLLFVLGAVVLSSVMASVDGRLETASLPRAMTTTVEGGRAILTAIAGGLITSVTLLLSLVLVAVQLASSQFSPRTLHDWTGDRTQQVTIGLVLGTSVYCLLVLRETSVVGEDVPLIPHLSVLLAVALGVLSLIAVVRYVDHLTASLRVGSVARSITSQTVDAVHRRGQRSVGASPGMPLATSSAAAPDPGLGREDTAVPTDAVAITVDEGGWVQQIDEDRLLDALPEGSTAHLTVAVGSHVLAGAPIVQVSPPVVDEECENGVRTAIAIGSERTMQEDAAYGIMQLVDVALRALSPGVNDPNTANEMIVNLGAVFVAYWSYPQEPTTRSDQGRTLVRRPVTHDDVLSAAMRPLRHHGADDPTVVETLLRMLITLRDEIERRDLPGPIQPVVEQIHYIHQAFLATDPPEVDRVAIRRYVTEADVPEPI